MAITIYIYANNGTPIEIPDSAEEPLRNNKRRLSVEEFDAALQRLAEASMKLSDPDAQPLSDDAMSRESIYEGHPKYDLSH